jgi:hypothetical protein
MFDTFSENGLSCSRWFLYGGFFTADSGSSIGALYSDGMTRIGVASKDLGSSVEAGSNSNEILCITVIKVFYTLKCIIQYNI